MSNTRLLCRLYMVIGHSMDSKDVFLNTVRRVWHAVNRLKCHPTRNGLDFVLKME